jgi:acyl-coenzyme A thioesterase PaaI-like protein
MFTLADCAFYALILGQHEHQVQAVTTNVGMNFFRRPTKQDLTAEARLIKMGHRLAVGDVLISSAGIPVAHASMTYALSLE